MCLLLICSVCSVSQPLKQGWLTLNLYSHNFLSLSFSFCLSASLSFVLLSETKEVGLLQAAAQWLKVPPQNQLLPSRFCPSTESMVAPTNVKKKPTCNPLWIPLIYASSLTTRIISVIFHRSLTSRSSWLSVDIWKPITTWRTFISASNIAATHQGCIKVWRMSGTEVELQFDIQTFNYGKAIDVILYLCWCNINSAGEQTCSWFNDSKTSLQCWR